MANSIGTTIVAITVIPFIGKAYYFIKHRKEISKGFEKFWEQLFKGLFNIK